MKQVKLKPGVSYRNFWRLASKLIGSDAQSVSPKAVTTIEDWRKAFTAVLDALRSFPEARQAANEAVLRLAEERQRQV